MFTFDRGATKGQKCTIGKITTYPIIPAKILELTHNKGKYHYQNTTPAKSTQSSVQKTMFYINGAQVTELKMESFKITIPSGGDALPNMPSFVSNCAIAPYKNLLLAVNCATGAGGVKATGYYWAKGMADWHAFGLEWTAQEELTFGRQVAPKGIILNQDEFHLFGGVQSFEQLSETGGETAACKVLNLLSGEWSACPNMPAGALRDIAVYSIDNTKALLISGKQGKAINFFPHSS